MSKITNPKSPPNWVVRFLEWFCPDELIEGVLGDLLEEYDVNSAQYSIKKANRRFIWSVFRFFHPSIILRNHRTVNFINMGILKNYFKVAFRSFWRQKLTTGINVFGLTLGITCASLAYIFIQHELSYDKFHTDAKNIYWFHTTSDQGYNLSITPTPLVPALVNNFSEITEGLRLDKKEILVKSKNEFFEEEVTYTDDNFFAFFDFELLEGTPQKVFENINAVVINQKMAKKYFGRSNPIGQIITLQIGEDSEDFQITGLAKNAPKNSSVQFDFLVPLKHAYRNNFDDLEGNWKKFGVSSFIRLQNQQQIASVEEKIIPFLEGNYKENPNEESAYTFAIHSLLDHHLFDNFSTRSLSLQTEINYVKILGLISLLILIVACLNFMILANAKSTKRLTEVGVRKVLGAKSRQLSNQFLLESILVSFIALFFSVLFIEYGMPIVENITGNILIISWLDPKIILPLIGITILTGVLAGIYPALVLSKAEAINSFKSTFKIGGNNWGTKGSLIFQFALSVGLLSCSFIMYQQQEFIKNRNLGYEPAEIIVVPTQVSYKEKDKSKQIFDQYKQAIQQLKSVKEISSVSWSFNRGNQVQFIQDESGQNSLLFEYLIDANYLQMLGVELAEGRNFNVDGGENEQGVIVNETFLEKYEIEGGVGYILPEMFNDYAGVPIIGVVKDYHFQNLRQEIQPMLLQTKNGRVGNILVKVDSKNMDNTLAELKQNWDKIRPEKPFDYSFMDEDIQQQYTSEKRWNKVISSATFMAILISMMGLFGLIALTLSERTKEIGVRKILGANLFDITWLVSRQFVLILFIASIIAIPLVLFGMQDWLQNFAYRIDIQWFVFFAAILLTAFLALLTTAIQSIKAALQNPVDALRTE